MNNKKARKLRKMVKNFVKEQVKTKYYIDQKTGVIVADPERQLYQTLKGGNR